MISIIIGATALVLMLFYVTYDLIFDSPMNSVAASGFLIAAAICFK